MENLNLPNSQLSKIQGLKGKKLIIFLLSIFVIFASVGAGVGFVIVKDDKPAQSADNNTAQDVPINVTQEIMYKGRITFVEPLLYPEDDISFALVNSSSERIILLKAFDQKLEVAEGHFAEVYGKLIKTKNGKEDVLLVNKVVIANQLSK